MNVNFSRIENENSNWENYSKKQLFFFVQFQFSFAWTFVSFSKRIFIRILGNRLTSRPFFPYSFQWTKRKKCIRFSRENSLFFFLICSILFFLLLRWLFIFWHVLIHNKIINIWCTRWWLCEEWLLIIILVDMLPLTAIVLYSFFFI